MTSDPDRQRYIWIPDFTEEEAGNYLTKVGFTDDKETRRMVFDRLGTRPSALRNIASSKMNPKEFIECQVTENFTSIKRCLTEDTRYKALLVEMVKDENKKGMSDVDVMDLCKLSTNKIAEGPAVKDFHVLSYDIQNRRFQFHSSSMYHATKQYLNFNK